MTDNATLRAKLRAMPDVELAELRERMGKRSTREASEIHLAALDEEYRREQAEPVTPIAAGARTGFANGVRTERSDPALVAAVIEAKRRQFEATAQVGLHDEKS